MPNLSIWRAPMIAFAMAFAVGASAQAGPDYDDYGDDYGYDYARVVDVEPIVRHVRKKRPVRECHERYDTGYEDYDAYDDDDYYREAHYNKYDDYDDHDRFDDRQTAGPTIAGGVIGGLVGHQFGKGRGRDAATLAGALIGAAIGHDKAAARETRSRRSHNHEPVRTCVTRYESYEEEYIDGYRVTYEFNGQQHTTRMRRDPGDEIRISVSVTPVSRY